MIRGILVLFVVGVIIGLWLWDRSEKNQLRRVFFALYNNALAKIDPEKNSNVHGKSINILEIMDELDMTPRIISSILANMEKKEYITMKSNILKLTPVGVGYFKFKYLSEEVKDDGGIR